MADESGRSCGAIEKALPANAAGMSPCRLNTDRRMPVERIYAFDL
jgi:hypothetical protein